MTLTIADLTFKSRSTDDKLSSFFICHHFKINDFIQHDYFISGQKNENHWKF